jgi:hypothetical protein
MQQRDENGIERASCPRGGVKKEELEGVWDDNCRNTKVPERQRGYKSTHSDLNR